MILYLVRHGDPIYDPDSLTPLGHEQAKAVAKRFALYGLDEVYASTSNRAIQTAKPTADLLKKEIKLEDWANEGHAWANLTVQTADGGKTWAFYDQKTKEKFRSDEVRNLGKKWYTHPCFEMDFEPGIRRIDEACDEFLLRLGYKHEREKNAYISLAKNEKRIALFAHQGFGIAFLSSLCDIPYPIFSTTFDLSHSSVTAIYFEPQEEGQTVYPKILQLSNDSHLYKEGILTGYNNGIKV